MRPDSPLRSRLALVAAVGIAVLGSGCRDGPRAAAPTAGEAPVVSTLVPAPEPSAPEPGQGFELVPVRFGRIELRVPAGWPVHDLDREPRTCVRWDSPAVYLGTPSADQECPAMAVGNEGGILVEPLGPASAPLPGERVTPGRIAGHLAYFDGDPALEGPGRRPHPRPEHPGGRGHRRLEIVRRSHHLDHQGDQRQPDDIVKIGWRLTRKAVGDGSAAHGRGDPGTAHRHGCLDAVRAGCAAPASVTCA